MRKAIAVYGGSFNPPTQAHFSLAEQVIADFSQIERVVFVPVGDAYGKIGLARAEQRFRMLEEVCGRNDNFDVSRVEIAASRVLHTYETLETLAKEYPDYDLYFLMGRDNLENLSIWGMSKELVERYKFIVFNRGEGTVDSVIEKDSLLKANGEKFFIMEEIVKTNCSSTKIRERLAKGKSVRYLVPDEVYQHIMDFKLYV